MELRQKFRSKRLFELIFSPKSLHPGAGSLTFLGRLPYHHSRSLYQGPDHAGPWRGFATSSSGKECSMPLFEVETENHIVITWAEDGDAASAVVGDAYPQEHVMRLTKRPRDTWVISKSPLGIAGKIDQSHTPRDCLSKAELDKVHAIRLYMHETGADLEQSRKAIESNMVMGW